MKRIIIALLCLTASWAMASDVVLGKIGDLSFSGSGTTFIGSWGAAPSGWTDPNTYLTYFNMTTNSDGLLLDISGNSYNFTNTPTPATGFTPTIVGTNVYGTVKYGMQGDGANDIFSRADIDEAFTNSATGTLHYWVRRNTHVQAVPNNVYGECLQAYCHVGANILPNLLVEMVGLDNANHNTNAFKIFLRTDAATQWALYTADNTVKTNNTWQLLSIVQNGVEPVVYLDGVLVPTTFGSSEDKTKWLNIATNIQRVSYGAWYYGSSTYRFYKGEYGACPQLNYAQTSNQVYEYWLNTQLPNGYIRIE